MNRYTTAACALVAAVVGVTPVPVARAQRGQPPPSGSVRTRLPPPDTMYGMPFAPDLGAVDADVVFLGVPSELGRNNANGAGSHLGPGAIRAASMIGGPGGPLDGIYDRDTGETMLKGVRLVDGGNVGVPAGLLEQTLKNVTDAVGTIVSRKAMPVVMGGDHSITFAVLRGYRDAGQKIHIIHFDAHQDFGPKLDRATGVPLVDQGNHLTHAIDLPWITGISMLGLRGMARGGGATASQAETRHIDRISASQVIRMGAAATVARIPAADAYYVTIDIDVLDSTLAPATGTPLPGGLSYYQLCDVLAAIAAKGRVVGFDIMEVSPPYDFQNRTSQVAAFVVARFLGAVFPNRK